jgi:hypothetical protein
MHGAIVKAVKPLSAAEHTPLPLVAAPAPTGCC